MIERFKRPRKALLVAASVVVLGGSLVAPALAEWSFWPGDVAQVAGTGGDGINVRSAPGIDASIVATLPEAAAVSIVDGPVWLDDGTSWYQVEADTSDGWFSGWVTGAYLGEMGTAVASITYEGPPPTPDDVASGVPLWVNTGGGSLNIRSAPGAWADVVGSAADGDSIEVLDVAVYDDAGSAWTLVNYYGTVGYVLSSYIGQSVSFNDGTAGTGGGSFELASSGELTIGETAWVTEGVNLRHPPGMDGGIISTIMAGNAVTLIDGPLYDESGDAWYQVEFDGMTGWIFGEYLSAGSATVTVNQGSIGSAIVHAAMQYQGVPYVWGGTTPDGFDCSGFTWYILSEVMGYDYPRPMEDQVVSGYYVSASELMPGDVVYFQNTYQWGLSHVGFYMGNGQFVHAGSENWGVGVGSLYDPYWQSRYVTARRVN